MKISYLNIILCILYSKFSFALGIQEVPDLPAPSSIPPPPGLPMKVGMEIFSLAIIFGLFLIAKKIK